MASIDPQPHPHAPMHDSASRVIGALSEPRAFLLFLLCVLILFEYSAIRRAETYSALMITFLETVESNRTRETSESQETARAILEVLAAEHNLVSRGFNVIERPIGGTSGAMQ